MSMPAWFEALVRLTLPPPPPQAEAPAPLPEVAAEEPAADAPIDWQRELASELRRTVELTGPTLANPAPPKPAPVGPAPVPVGPAPVPAHWVPTTPPPLVRPVVNPPRSAYTAHGFEPGSRPTTLAQHTALMYTVYWPALESMIPYLVHDEELFAAIEKWDMRRPAMNRPLLFVLFKRLSYWLGETLRFDPAQLGYLDDEKGRQLSGYYSNDTRKIFIATQLFRFPVAQVVATIVHEQMHHLQNLTRLLLRHKPHKLGEAERSLALYWEKEPQIDHRADNLGYRFTGIEYHAEKTARYVLHRLAPVFEWPGEYPP